MIEKLVTLRHYTNNHLLYFNLILKVKMKNNHFYLSIFNKTNKIYFFKFSALKNIEKNISYFHLKINH